LLFRVSSHRARVGGIVPAQTPLKKQKGLNENLITFKPLHTRMREVLSTVLLLLLRTVLSSGDPLIVTFNSRHVQDDFCRKYTCVQQYYNAVNAALVDFDSDIEIQTDALFVSENLTIERDCVITQIYDAVPLTFPMNKFEVVKPAASNRSLGYGVNVYVLDNGIRVSHAEFVSMDSNETRVLRDGPHTEVYGGGNEGCRHGTHVASIAAGQHVGLAKKSMIFDIPTLNCYGIGKISDALMSIEWLIENIESPAVVLMAWCTPYNKALDKATQSLVNLGVKVVTAAGNYRDDACNYSPSSTALCITVGTKGLQVSNYGECVDIYANGIDIMGAYSGADNLYLNMSGTSMSAAYIAGLTATELLDNQEA
jgi:subtilisin family serine protease